MLSLDESRSLLGARVQPLAPVELALEQAWGCRLDAVPRADVDLPPGDVAAMDGYAVRAADTAGGKPLPVACVIPAGSPPRSLPPASAARIFTGALVPAGADTVVPQEDAAVTGDGAVRLAPTPAGANVRRKGEIFTAGTPLARRRDVITPQRTGTLAAGGSGRVRVFPRPRLGLLVTGEELVEPGALPGPGQIRNSNGPMLAALAREASLAVTARTQVGDTLPALCRALERMAGEADLIVSSGGVSVGDLDLVPRAVGELGGEVILHRVKVQPGKPVFVAQLGGAWLVGLPGNPGSVLVCWRMFARPLAEGLAGDPEPFAEEPLPAELTTRARNRGERTLLRPAVLAAGPSGLRAEVLSWHGSHDVASSSAANALVRLEGGAELAAGATVSCYPLSWRCLGTG